MHKPSAEEMAFLNDLKILAKQGPKVSANLLLISIFMFFFGAVFWASQAELDSVTRGMGKVIPTSQVKIVQNLEGGILAEILVKEGDLVKNNQVLLRLDDTTLSSKLKENRSEFYSLSAQISRLNAEISDTKPEFPIEVKENAPLLIDQELDLYEAKKRGLASKIEILKQKEEQHVQELFELESRIIPLTKSLDLVEEELAITQPMYDKGITSRVELLRLKRQLNDLELKSQSTLLTIPKLKAVLAEAKRRIQEERESFRTKSLRSLNKAKAKLTVLMDAWPTLRDRVLRTEVKAPVAGIVKRVWVNTIGGVIKSGMPLVEIVPMEEKLLVEARLKPSDIAFVHPDQRAQIKITAYDFAIYGALEAQLQHISADTIKDDKGDSYYLIRVITQQKHLIDKKGKKLPIIPGMTAEVNIITGKKTVLNYLLKPVLRAWGSALRER